MSNAPQAITDLVERFAHNIDHYHRPEYNETQVRREFLDPLFIALGWDVENRQGASPRYQEVIHEATVRARGEVRSPDYCFRVGAERKFFVEAKKPAVDIRYDIHPAYQLRRYGWTAKLPLSILTDFEEFSVYDCRFRPAAGDNAAKARILYVTCDEYAERWEEIASIFARHAVWRGDFDRYAEATRSKRGTQEVDAAFLKDIEEWRVILARNIALRNPDLSVRDLNYAVQQIIDRIIFLRITEDRDIEPYGQLKDTLAGRLVYQGLLEIFHRADDRYNSGLFHFRPERGRAEEPDVLTPALRIDDKALAQIIDGLYYPESPYEFSMLGVDILGNVYEQFLGSVIRLTPAHRAVVEQKPEVRKAGGVYYTPKYIVDYIVEATVGRLLSPTSEVSSGLTSEVSETSEVRPDRVAKLRILDPACGSGSFLLGAYQYLLDYHLNWYVEHPTIGGRSEIYQGNGGDWFLTTEEKKRILLNSIYGVDIDPQAVGVTKLSLLLKVLEDESGETIAGQMAMWQERALPDLASNIKCGNSLIGPDFYDGQQMSFLDEEERYRINVFDWEAEFPEIMRSAGFDAVIGNPPYGAYLYEREKSYLAAKFEHQTYQLDSYLLFLEKCIRDLLRGDGFYGMIISNPWLTNLFQTSMRRFVTLNARVVEIVHFRFPVFRKVTVDTQVVILQKADPSAWKALATIASSLEAFLAQKDCDDLLRIWHEQNDWLASNGAVINIFLSSAEKALARNCAGAGEPLSSYCAINVGIKPYQTGKGQPPQTREMVKKRVFDSDFPRDATYRQYLRGKDIGRYKTAPLKPRYLEYGPWLAEPRPAADFDASPKILMRQTGDSLVATLDLQRYLCLNNMHVLVPKSSLPDARYLLGIVNSTLLNWYYHTLNPEMGEALAEVKKTNVAKLPIRTIDFDDPDDNAGHDQMVALVERMLGLHKQLADARTPTAKTMLGRQIDATDRQIDRLVYELYDLTDEEIAIVENDS